MDSAVVLEEAMAAISLPPKELPTPHPPSGRKRDLYYDPVVFRELDEDVFKVRTLYKCLCFLKLHKSVNSTQKSSHKVFLNSLCMSRTRAYMSTMHNK